MRLPRQDQCNMNDPEEHALWALVCPPGVGQTPMLIPAFIARSISKLLWECGFRHHPELQTKKYQRPLRGPQHMLNGSGHWVDMDTPEPEPLRLPNISAMTAEERALVLDQYRALGELPEPAKPRNVARVVNK